MIKIQCPQCQKSFLWSDNMPPQGACPNPECQGNYNIHEALKQNIAHREGIVEQKVLRCPFCREEIFSRLNICPHCNCMVLGPVAVKKSYFFIAVCIMLIIISLILKYAV